MAGILWGLHSQNSHTALGYLTDDFGTGAHLRCFSEKTEEIMKLCLRMGREFNCLIPDG